MTNIRSNMLILVLYPLIGEVSEGLNVQLDHIKIEDRSLTSNKIM